MEEEEEDRQMVSHAKFTTFTFQKREYIVRYIPSMQTQRKGSALVETSVVVLAKVRLAFISYFHEGEGL